MSEPYWTPLGPVAGSVLDNAGYGTALPGSPVDGQEYVLVDSATAPTRAWRFRYVAAKATNKWVFVGGSPGFDEVTASETVSTSSYAALTTPGPSFTVPVAGIYDVEIGFVPGSPGAVMTVSMSYDIGGTAAVDADRIFHDEAALNAAPTGNIMRPRRKSLGAVTLVAKYKIVSSSIPVQDRWMRVTPVAVGG